MHERSRDIAPRRDGRPIKAPVSGPWSWPRAHILEKSHPLISSNLISGMYQHVQVAAIPAHVFTRTAARQCSKN